MQAQAQANPKPLSGQWPVASHHQVCSQRQQSPVPTRAMRPCGTTQPAGLRPEPWKARPRLSFVNSSPAPESSWTGKPIGGRAAPARARGSVAAEESGAVRDPLLISSLVSADWKREAGRPETRARWTDVAVTPLSGRRTEGGKENVASRLRMPVGRNRYAQTQTETRRAG